MFYWNTTVGKGRAIINIRHKDLNEIFLKIKELSDYELTILKEDNFILNFLMPNDTAKTLTQ